MTCGFRVYHRALVERIFPREDGFVATSEIMLRALIAGARVLEFPATNTKREHGVSKMRFLQTVLRHMKLIARVLLSRLGPPMPVNAHLERIQWNE
jgi:dolichol-phosphate mannosyltransferase